MSQLKFGGVPLHPFLVHFPVAAWVLALVTDLAFAFTGNPLCWSASFALLWVGAIMGLLAIVSGMSEFLALRNNEAAVKWMLMHARLVGIAWLVLVIDVVLRKPQAPAETPWLPIGLTIVGVVLLAWGAHIGARMVYRWGVGTTRPGS